MTKPAFDFDSNIDRRDTNSQKWDRYKGQDIIPAWVADMDFRSAPTIIEALHDRVSHGIFGYTSASQQLIEAVQALFAREYSWRIEPDWITWLPGLVSGINISCRAVGALGDEILTFTPVYPPFLTAPGFAERSLIKVPLRLHEQQWMWDPKELEEAITPRTRLLLLCNPHNPVGRVWSQDELLQLTTVAEKHDLIICSDEIHSGLVLDEHKQHVAIASLYPEIASRTITLQAPSKTFNIPGLGCSFAIISDRALRRSFRRAMNGIVPHVNTLGFTAALAAYTSGEEWRQELIRYLRQNRDLVMEAIAKMPGLSVTPVEATYLAWIGTEQSGIQQPARFFERAGVGLSDGSDFDSPGYLRLNFGCPRAVLNEILRRMQVATNCPDRFA